MKVLLSRYFPELIYEYGVLDPSLPFEALHRQSLINERARAADGGAEFSRRIRAEPSRHLGLGSVLPVVHVRAGSPSR